MRRTAALVFAAVLAGGATVPLDAGAQPRRVVTIASGWVVGVYYPLAGAMSAIVHNTRDANIRATVESSGASVANAQLIGTGDVEFALIQNDIAYYAFNGVTLSGFAGKPIKNMAGVFSIYPELVHIAAARRAGIRSPADLRGKRVGLGPPGSGSEQNALQILEVHGLKESDLAAAARLDAAAAADELRDGRIDAAFFTTGLGSAVLIDVFQSGTAMLVPIGSAEADVLRNRFPFYTVEKVPANTYKGQDREVVTPAVMAMLVARRDVPEDVVHRFAKAIFDNLSQFHAAHPAARHLTLHTALRGMPIPLHLGAEKFYREKGLAR
jgi:TRAP transporter TAXI family solute receptor